MTDSHLLNTIALIERKTAAQQHENLMAAYRVYGTLSGEMATYYCEQDIDVMEEDPNGEEELPPIYWDMKNEVEQRKLTCKSL